jgi:protein-S-isoprenylcysteine O-methyltransferase Ste14
MPELPQLHRTLAHLYLVYFLASMVGLFADAFFSFPVSSAAATPIAMACFGGGPLLIAWAQYTSSHFKKAADGDAYYYHGPYRYLRNPTHLGLLILVTGYTLVSGSLIFFTITVIGYLISNILFKKYESILERTGNDYEAYRSKVQKVL